MKKLIALILIFVCAFSLTGCSRVKGEEGLIAKARKEINLAEADTVDMVIAGKSTVDRDTHLFWFITGNEYQMNRCHPIEFTKVGENEYKFVKKYNPIPRGQDIYALQWRRGYSFIVNNPACRSIRIVGHNKETEVEVDQIPFVYYYSGLPGEYMFFDGEGNQIW